MKLKCLSIIGARPQFIKAAPLSRQMKKSGIKEIIVHTGQHYDYNMSKIFFRELNIKEPEYNLGIGSLSHGSQTGRMIEKIESVLLAEKPGIVLVYGDTNSTLAGALAAAKLHIPVAHVEAGLRSYNRDMPEEVNRVLTDHVSDILFCPTKTAVKNLRQEGFRNIINNGNLINSDLHLPLPIPSVLNVGDVMYDSILYNLKIAAHKSTILSKLSLKPNHFYLVTVHRAENTDSQKKLISIFSALNRLADDFTIVMPVHPRTKKIISSEKAFQGKIRLIPPVSYLDMLMLMSSARVMLTDSGGLQKEAFFLNVPCVTLREESEWVETLHDGFNILAGTDTEKIVCAVRRQDGIKLPGNKKKYFGDGNASEKIAAILNKIIF